MPRFADVFAEQKPVEKRPVSQKIKRIHYSKIIESSYQYRDRTDDVVGALADLIKADGKVLEPCIVRKSGGDTYELIAGHKRRRACIYLVEQEGLEQFALVPCIEEEMTDVRAEFAVYSSNGYDEKTPYEIMREIEGMSRLLTEHSEEFPEFAGKGRMVEKLASKLQMSRSVVSDYKNISHNLGEKGMEAFKTGSLDKSAAVTLASMPEEQQEEILAKGLTKREAIKGYVKTTAIAEKQPTSQADNSSTEADEPLEGQMSIKDYPELLPEDMLQAEKGENVHSGKNAEADAPIQIEEALMELSRNLGKAVLKKEWSNVLSCVDEIQFLAKRMMCVNDRYQEVLE